LVLALPAACACLLHLTLVEFDPERAARRPTLIEISAGPSSIAISTTSIFEVISILARESGA
jgi:hypothetical protein